MNLEWKGQSPFYPGQPVPAELFAGQEDAIKKILRSAHQVLFGKPQAVFISGEYGIGKSSLAGYIRRRVELEPSELLGFHVFLGGVATLDELVERTVDAIGNTTVLKPKSCQSIRAMLAKYAREHELFGVKIQFDQLKKDIPSLSLSLLPFLQIIYKEMASEYNGIILIYDEIDGIAKHPEFGSFLKNLVDENAVSDTPLPLLLTVCGTEEQYRDIVDHDKPVDRTFDRVHIDKMSYEEMEGFFQKAFRKAGMKVDEKALSILLRYAGGLPRLMHLIGESAYWIAPHTTVDSATASSAIEAAGEDIGRKYLNPQVYKALKNKDYHPIISKLATLDDMVDCSFKKSSLESKLNAEEKKIVSGFLTKMKSLNVITSGEERGEYVFMDYLTYQYFRMKALVKDE